MQAAGKPPAGPGSPKTKTAAEPAHASGSGFAPIFIVRKSGNTAVGDLKVEDVEEAEALPGRASAVDGGLTRQDASSSNAANGTDHAADCAPSVFVLDAADNVGSPSPFHATRGDSTVSVSQIELTQQVIKGLRGWAKVKRLVMHYVRFLRAFSCLRNLHIPLDLDTQMMKRMERLGEGCFAICSRCVALDNHGNKREMALKLLKHGSGDQDVDDFIREREVLKKLRHSRIIEYIDSGNMQLPGMHFPEMYLAMEYMKGGSVRDIILKQMDSPHRRVYTKMDAWRWLLDIARALDYMHSRSPCVIHRDLKPENIMLSGPNPSTAVAKLADFGLHCLVERAGTDAEDVYQLTGNTGSLMYMSPEVFRLEPYNEKTDVFSFAVNFWELFNCTLMIARITNMGTQEEIYDYACGVSNGIRPVIPVSWPSRIASLLSDCWDPYPQHRPGFDVIVKRLQDCREDIEAMEAARNSGGCCACQ